MCGQGWSCNQVFEGHSHYVMQASRGHAPPLLCTDACTASSSLIASESRARNINARAFSP